MVFCRGNKLIIIIIIVYSSHVYVYVAECTGTGIGAGGVCWRVCGLCVYGVCSGFVKWCFYYYIYI